MSRLIAIAAALLLAAAAQAWDAHGHRTITYLALDGLPADMPGFLRELDVRHQVAFQSNEVDRWRGSKYPVLAHENNQDHYLDLDLLDQFGLTVATLPPLRNEYLRALIIAKHEHPERIDPYDASRDPDRSKEWPGALPYAIVEHWAKLQMSFQTLRVLEKLDDPQRQHQLAQARANVITEMGYLSHFVGDAAQPLHTTKHHHGWVGPNPHSYTTEKSFHSYIDGGCIDKHGLTYAVLRPLQKYEVRINPRDPWKDTLEYIEDSFELVEPLYRLQRSGELDQEAGRAFLCERLTTAADMLRAMYVAAWISSAPDLKAEEDFKRYNNFKPQLLPTEIRPAAGPGAAAGNRSPAAQPAAAAPAPVTPAAGKGD